LIVRWVRRFLFFVVPHQFSPDTGEWPQNQILIPDWTYFHCPGTTLVGKWPENQNFYSYCPLRLPKNRGAASNGQGHQMSVRSCRYFGHDQQQQFFGQSLFQRNFPLSTLTPINRYFVINIYNRPPHLMSLCKAFWGLFFISMIND